MWEMQCSAPWKDKSIHTNPTVSLSASVGFQPKMPCMRLMTNTSELQQSSEPDDRPLAQRAVLRGGGVLRKNKKTKKKLVVKS